MRADSLSPFGETSTLLLSLASLAFLGACGDIGLGTGLGSSGANGGGGTPPAGSATSGSDTSTGGVSCATDSQTGVTLCEGVSFCPGVAVDPSVFPGCGFRLRSSAELDLECLCNGVSLCPIGVPTTCAEALQLLDASSRAGGLLAVCQAVDQGGCLDVGVDAGPSPSSACDPACESQCQSDPGCVSLCGC